MALISREHFSPVPSANCARMRLTDVPEAEHELEKFPMKAFELLISFFESSRVICATSTELKSARDQKRHGTNKENKETRLTYQTL